MSDIPLDFLAKCSIRSVEEYMLARENHAANIRKQLRIVIDELIDEATEAAFARWMLANRDEVRKAMSVEEVPVLDGRSTGRGVAEELCKLGNNNSEAGAKIAGSGSTEKARK